MQMHYIQRVRKRPKRISQMVWQMRSKDGEQIMEDLIYKQKETGKRKERVMDRVMEICILVYLLCNLISHHYLNKRIDILQEWIEVLHGIDFKKLTKVVREWQAERKEGE